MKKKLGAFFIVASISLFVVTHLPSVNVLKAYPTSTLEQEERDLQMQVDALKITNAPLHKSKVTKLQIKVAYYKIELHRRKFELEWVTLALLIFGIGLIASGVVRKRKNMEGPVRKVRVVEVLPTETYVSEQEYARRREDSFVSKDEALQWFESDPLRICSYCGSDSVKPIRGKQDEVQLVTFYKKVPEGARDLRIIFGAHWFVHAVPELQCENCKQKVVR